MTDDQTVLLPVQHDSATPTAPGRPAPGRPAPDRPSPSDDQTALIPKQRDSPTPHTPRPTDGWTLAPAAASAPVGGTDTGRDRALTTLAWLLPTLAMAALAMVRATWPNLRAEELATWAAAGSDWSQLWRSRADADVTALPNELLIRLWAELAGTSDLALRVPSMAMMTAAVALTSMLTSRLAGARAGLLAGAVLVAVPASSRWAQEAGGAALAVLTALVATFALVALLDRPGAWRTAGYATALVPLLLSHPGTLVLLLAHGLVIAVMRPRQLPAWSAASVFGAAPLAALLVIEPPPWVTDGGGAEPPSADVLAALGYGGALIAGIVTGLGLFSVSLRKPAAVFTTWAVLPLAGLAPALRLTGYDPLPLLLFALPAWAALAALTLSRAPVVRGLLICTVVAVTGVAAQIDIRGPAGHGLAAVELADTLDAELAPGDVIVHGATPREAQATRDLIARYLPTGRQPRDALVVRPQRTGGFRYASECPEPAGCLGEAARIWLIRLGPAADPLAGFPAATGDAVRATHEAAERWEFQGLTLHLFAPKPAGQGRGGAG